MPLQVERAGRAEPALLEGCPERRTTDAFGKAVHRASWKRADPPASERRTRFGRACLAEEKPGNPKLGCPQREAPARREIERLRRATDDREHGGEPRAAQALLEGPQRFFWPAGAHDDQFAGIEPEPGQPGAERQPRLGEHGLLLDPQHRLPPLLDDPGQEPGGKAGQRAGAARFLAAEFMQRLERQPAAELVVDFRDAERDPAPRVGECRFTAVREKTVAVLQADRTTLDMGDFAPKSGELGVVHGGVGRRVGPS